MHGQDQCKASTQASRHTHEYTRPQAWHIFLLGALPPSAFSFMDASHALHNVSIDMLYFDARSAGMEDSPCDARKPVERSAVRRPRATPPRGRTSLSQWTCLESMPALNLRVSSTWVTSPATRHLLLSASQPPLPGRSLPTRPPSSRTSSSRVLEIMQR